MLDFCVYLSFDFQDISDGQAEGAACVWEQAGQSARQHQLQLPPAAAGSP